MQSLRWIECWKSHNAGDFNDWQERASRILTGAFYLTEFFGEAKGRAARSYPLALPLFRLYCTYVRCFYTNAKKIYPDYPGLRIFDHAVLSAKVIRI